MCQLVLLLGVVHREQRTRVSRRENPGSDPSLHRGRQPQQTQGVGHLRPGTPDAVGQLVMRALELLEQLVVRSRLLQRVELSPVKVLQERVQEELLVIRGPDDGGDPLQTRFTAGPPASLAHDELKAVGTGLPYDDRLKKTDLLDGGHQLGKRVLVEDLSGLTRVRRDGVEQDLGEVRPCHLARPVGPGRIRNRSTRLRHRTERGHLGGSDSPLGRHDRTRSGRGRTGSGRRDRLLLRSGGNQGTEPSPQPSTTLTHWIPSEVFCWLFRLPVWACCAS